AAFFGVVGNAPVGAVLRIVFGCVGVRVQTAGREQADGIEPGAVRPRRAVEPLDDAPHGEGATHRASVPSHGYAPAPFSGGLRHERPTRRHRATRAAVR